MVSVLKLIFTLAESNVGLKGKQRVLHKLRVIKQALELCDRFVADRVRELVD
jgi:hypothetical protein